MRDEPLTVCPKCGKKALKRLVGTGAGLIFKGSGFYITDYKKKSGAKSEGGETKAAETKPSESKSSSAPPKPGAGKSSDPKK